MNFGSRYLLEGFSELDEICQLDRGGFAIRHHPDWWTLVQGSPWRAKILKGVKKFVTLFLVRHLTEGDEISHG